MKPIYYMIKGLFNDRSIMVYFKKAYNSFWIGYNFKSWKRVDKGFFNHHIEMYGLEGYTKRELYNQVMMQGLKR